MREQTRHARRERELLRTGGIVSIDIVKRKGDSRADSGKERAQRAARKPNQSRNEALSFSLNTAEMTIKQKLFIVDE
jgi:hypothetical protein